MKIALITDTHWGVRNDAVAFYQHFEKFYSEVFFPYIDQHGITEIHHLGDIVDRRKYISYMTLRKLRSQFIQPCIDRNLTLRVIIGNHDTTFKNTNEVNSMNEIFSGHNYDKFHWYSDPTEVTVDGTKIMFMPWICSGNIEQCMNAMRDTDAQILFGHLELSGFEMHRGAQCDNGWDPDLFKKFEMVCTGHFHHKSTRGNVNYLGSPYEMTWIDYNDPRGFHIFDTDTRELTFIQNPFRMFNKLFYDDLNESFETVTNPDLSGLQDTYVKVIVKNKTNPYWFDLFMDKVEKSCAVDIQVVDDHMNLDLTDDDDIVNEAEDTLTIMKKFSSQFVSEPSQAVELDKFLTSLYQEALSMETGD